MTRKDKVKELVGRGLNSYHAKALQQIDRINKKNKEQNHKISILTNELDNDYLTKTEEGSVISLEHSKEGMVYLDELQGNTMVNYCTDGSKEMTLNGDIDVEGTFVTTTEGVDGGLVDVMCEGNTLVNHCTDGPKELTLNGEIDASGTFITTTEGVDGGKVDVYCEGNTLVNLKLNSGIVCDIFCGGDKNTYCRIDECTPISIKGEILQTGQENGNTWQYYNFGRINTSMLKTNTTYTLIIKDIYNASGKVYIQNGDTSHCFTDNSSITSTYKNNLNYVVMRTKSDFANLNSNYPILYGSLSSTFKGKIDVSVIGFFEGDWTNKEIPAYFEGMKSVGQDDVSGHKIEIVSQNRNLFNINEKNTQNNYTTAEIVGNRLKVISRTVGGTHRYYAIKINNLIPNTKYTVKMNYITAREETICRVYQFNGVGDLGNKYANIGDSFTFTTPAIVDNIYFLAYINFVNPCEIGDYIEIENIQITKGETIGDFVPYASNTKQIPLSAPLRGLPNGVKDKFVKKEGKWYVERNCGEYIFTGLEPWSISESSDVSKRFVLNGEFVPNLKLHSDNNTIAPIICNKYAVYPVIPTLTSTDTTGIGLTNIGFSIREAYTSLDAFKSYLTQSSIKVVYQLATPTYEPIENVELITYLETTHISNNSLIPCNMVVKNTGYNTIAIKPSTLYTVALDKTGSGTMSVNLCGATATTTTNKLTLTTPATLTSDLLTLSGKGVKGSKIRLLEGDKSGEIPGYFEGMKSVGQDDENGHKIEISSKNKNLLKNPSLATKSSWDTYFGTMVDGVNGNKGVHSEYVTTSLGYYNFLEQTTFTKGSKNNIIKTDRWYTFSFYAKGIGKVRTYIYPNTIDTTQKGIVDGVEKTLLTDGSCDWNLTDDWVKHTYTFKSKSDLGDYSRLLFRLMPSGTDTLNTATISCPMLEEGKVATNFVDNLSNKKEILLNEPLRSLPNGVKDRFVKIGGKWFIERNCGKTVLNGSESWTLQTSHTNDSSFLLYTPKVVKSSTCLSDKLICNTNITTASNTDEGIICGASYNVIYIRINKTRLSTQDVSGFKTWLFQNPTTVIYELATPTYEPIENIELITYLETTHISNNSLIPCNMKIKNSGYNAIIKPSTLYTVALDTNKAGTIGVNLGGAKGTTNNNVLTLTTPATLSDDSLRVSGKGIKGSKLRLLEGDKTNWVPSFFEGMQSSFEDKFDEVDNCYKMEILSNNENLIDIANNSWETIGSVGLIEKIGSDITFDCNGSTTGGYGVKMSEFMHLKPNTQYVLNANWEILRGTTDLENLYLRIFSPMTNTYFGTRSFDGLKFTTDATGIVKPMLYIDTPSRHDIKVKFTDIQLKEVGNVNYILNKHNKIQFSSIEPLRSVGDVKDRFVFVDGKLMIERKCRAYVCDDNSKWVISSGKGEDTSNAYYIRLLDAKQVKKTHDFIASNKAYGYTNGYCRVLNIDTDTNVGFYNYTFETIDEFKQKQYENPTTIVYELKEPIYEEIPYELQKIILEGYENGTLFIDTNIPPTVTTTYAGETPIVNATKTNRVEVSSNTTDINENIIPYLMDMDYRVAVLYLQSENISGTMNVSRVFGGVKEMLIRDIKSKRYSAQEYLNRISTYHAANKITIEEMEEIKSVIMEVYNG